MILNSEKISAFCLSLDRQSRDGKMVDSLRLQAFSKYHVALLRSSLNTYLLGANFDDESFAGEGETLQNYLRPQAEGIFLVDKAFCDSFEKFPHFILNQTGRQVVNGTRAFCGTLLFEFEPHPDVDHFDVLFNSSYYDGGNSSTRDLKKNTPYWKELVGPRIRKNGSVFMVFLALGQQLVIFGPESYVGQLQIRAQEQSCEWHDLDAPPVSQ